VVREAIDGTPDGGTLSASGGSEPLSSLRFDLHHVGPTVCCCSVAVPREAIVALYEQAARGQQSIVQAPGFIRGSVPVEYIKQNFKEHLLEHLEEFLLRLGVVNFLYRELRLRKQAIVGDPRLTRVELAPSVDATFYFDANILHDVAVYEWKYLPFAAPQRKKYRDLDRQVKTFLEEEQAARESYTDESINEHDWVGFRMSVVDEADHHVAPDLSSDFWLKIGSEETESSLREVFRGKRVGDVFVTDDRGAQEYFSNCLDSCYRFRIEITNLVPHAYFCVDSFKRQFRVKTRKDTHDKFIEVFSFRNHITQRRAMAQEALALLISKHPFDVPNHLVLRQQEEVLNAVRQSSDYNVYRTQSDFDLRLRQLAIKQVKEAVFVDALAYHENLVVTDQDICCYLNLMNRPRMKEFLYFSLPSFKIQGQEMPIPGEQLKRVCMREKALNHAIYHLTKD